MTDRDEIERMVGDVLDRLAAMRLRRGTAAQVDLRGLLADAGIELVGPDVTVELGSATELLGFDNDSDFPLAD